MGVVRVAKGMVLVISKEDVNGNIRIIKSQENSGVLIDGVTKKRKRGYNNTDKIDNSW